MRGPEPESPFLLRVGKGLSRPSSVGARLRRILMVSLVLAIALVGVLVDGRLSDYRTAVDISRMVDVTLGVQDLVHSLQKERGLTNGLLGGGEYYAPSVDAQRMQTDAALVALNGLIADPAYTEMAARSVRAALGPLTGLAGIRAGVDGHAANGDAVFEFYNHATSALNRVDLGLDRIDDPALRRGLRALYALSEAKDYADRERGLLNGVFAAGRFQRGQAMQFAEIGALKDAALDDYRNSATVDQLRAVDAALGSRVAVMAGGFEAIARDSATNSPDGRLSQHVEPQNNWWNQMTLLINDLRVVQQSVGQDITARADQLRGAAARELIIFLLIGALAVGIEVMLVVGAARSIIGPLRSLASDADEVAARKLPEAVAAVGNAASDEIAPLRPPPLVVPSPASSEIRQVARALGRLRDTAFALAVEQTMIRRNAAVSLANLGRRHQNLLRRQLGLIRELERERLDPAVAANMFELGHLATRMRRNTESLLVLVGEPGLRPWSESLPVTEVIAAALSEVDDYRRVSAKQLDPAQVSGHAVAEVAHLLAELLENGLAFSPPEFEVEVHGRHLGDAYMIVIIDQGTGMSDEALASANARLRGQEGYVVAPTRYLGHFVVGRLARRLGAAVNLEHGLLAGIVARIMLPGNLLVEPGPGPAGRGPVAGTTPLRPIPLRNQRVRIDLHEQREQPIGSHGWPGEV